jgi:Txe/YoeB family toxin of toxin-antitoxin system
MSKRFLREYRFLRERNGRLSAKVADLLKEIESNPIRGTGKVERLGEYRYSRRVDGKNRLVYEVFAEKVVLICCLGHYGDH